MTRDDPSMDISHMPDLLRLARQVHGTGNALRLRAGHEELAVLMPPRRRTRTRSRPRRPLTQEESDFFLAVGGAPLARPRQLQLEL